MGCIRHFSDLLVWQKAHSLFVDLCGDVDEFPQRRSATIVADQIIRSSGSISANIAEGFLQSRKKFVCSLNIALGEANETENWLYNLRDCGLITKETATARLKHVTEIRKMLLSLKRSIEQNTNTIKEPETSYELSMPNSTLNSEP